MPIYGVLADITQYIQIRSDAKWRTKSPRGMLAEYDGVAEVWFESEHALLEGISSPEGQKLGAALLKDESNFIDHSKSSAFIVEEREFWG